MTEIHSATASFIQSLKFRRIGCYSGVNGKLERRVEPGIKISERLDLIYLLKIGQQIMYVGETVQGYRRPLSYHKNDVMKTVRDGIFNSIKDNNSLDVYARSEDFHLNYEGLDLNLRVSLEIALIKKFNPPWNKKVEDKD